MRLLRNLFIIIILSVPIIFLLLCLEVWQQQTTHKSDLYEYIAKIETHGRQKTSPNFGRTFTGMSQRPERLDLRRNNLGEAKTETMDRPISTRQHGVIGFGNNSIVQRSNGPQDLHIRSCHHIGFHQEQRGDYKLYIDPMGRLGNQLFQMASVIGIAAMTNRTPVLSPVFRAIHNVFDISLPSDYTPARVISVEEETFGRFSETLLHMPCADVKLIGYFQTWKYFNCCFKEIRKQLQIKADLNSRAEVTLREARHTVCDGNNCATDRPVFVGVHVRRGDLLFNPTYRSPSIRYLGAAIQYYRLRIPSSIFVVVSDDTEWCERNINGVDVFVVREGQYEDHFAILSKCNHTIITVGTFGWWAAWIAGGEAVYYEQPISSNSTLFNKFSASDHFPPQWIPLSE